MHRRLRRAKAILILNDPRSAPPSIIEYSYYAIFLYASSSVALGLSVNMLVPGLLAVLAAACVSCRRSRVRAVYASIVYPLSFALSYIAVQVVLHNEPFMADTVRPFVPWMLMVVILQSLSLRQGFSHRFAFVTFILLLTTLPSLIFVPDGDVLRAKLDGAAYSIANPNDLGAWSGFCAVYFTVFAVETKRPILCAASWLVVSVCLYIVGLSVSRGALLAVVVAATVAGRRLLKRGFLPLLLLLLFGWVVYELGLFGPSMAAFATRGAEETGRFLVWPLAIERFVSSPLIGVGGGNIETYVPSMGKFVTPHNTFLAIALASGVIPLAFFVAYWIRAGRGAFCGVAERVSDAPFRIPLLLYTFLLSLEGTGAYMAPWGILALSMGIAAHRGRRVPMLRRVGGHATAARRQDEAGYAMHAALSPHAVFMRRGERMGS
jgi:O-Antigen ligase